MFHPRKHKTDTTTKTDQKKKENDQMEKAEPKEKKKMDQIRQNDTNGWKLTKND